VAQIGEAVTQMDHATQQNAALVEEIAAAAGSLKGQAQDLVQTVSIFKLSGDQESDIRSQYRTANQVALPIAKHITKPKAIRANTNTKRQISAPLRSSPAVQPKAISAPPK
jgi:hypothetical protein